MNSDKLLSVQSVMVSNSLLEDVENKVMWKLLTPYNEIPMISGFVTRVLYQGSQVSWKTWKITNSFSRAWKCP